MTKQVIVVGPPIKKRLGKMGLGEMGLGKMGLGEMLPNPSKIRTFTTLLALLLLPPVRDSS